LDTAVVPLLSRQRGAPPPHALAYNLGNFLRTLALPGEVKRWTTTLRERLVKIGAGTVQHGRSVIFQMAKVMVSWGCSARPWPPSRRCVHRRRRDAEDRRRGQRAGMLVGEVRPRGGFRA
jgi:hypothetical protein